MVSAADPYGRNLDFLDRAIIIHNDLFSQPVSTSSVIFRLKHVKITEIVTAR
jgi:hypothetical protein